MLYGRHFDIMNVYLLGYMFIDRICMLNRILYYCSTLCIEDWLFVGRCLEQKWVYAFVNMILFHVFAKGKLYTSFMLTKVLKATEYKNTAYFLAMYFKSPAVYLNIQKLAPKRNLVRT